MRVHAVCGRQRAQRVLKCCKELQGASKNKEKMGIPPQSRYEQSKNLANFFPLLLRYSFKSGFCCFFFF